VRSSSLSFKWPGPSIVIDKQGQASLWVVEVKKELPSNPIFSGLVKMDNDEDLDNDGEGDGQKGGGGV
jgi:hypothetical protein